MHKGSILNFTLFVKNCLPDPPKPQYIERVHAKTSLHLPESWDLCCSTIALETIIMKAHKYFIAEVTKYEMHSAKEFQRKS